MIKKKNQKPISIEAHFRYRCPNIECGYTHWLSLKEVKTSNFKVVCDCGKIFKPKRIKKLKIVYDENAKISTKQSQPLLDESISESMKNLCIKTLIQYGFTEDESKQLIDKTYKIYKPDTTELLIKYALQNFGAINEPTEKT